MEIQMKELQEIKKKLLENEYKKSVECIIVFCKKNKLTNYKEFDSLDCYGGISAFNITDKYNLLNLFYNILIKADYFGKLQDYRKKDLDLMFKDYFNAFNKENSFVCEHNYREIREMDNITSRLKEYNNKIEKYLQDYINIL